MPPRLNTTTTPLSLNPVQLTPEQRADELLAKMHEDEKLTMLHGHFVAATAEG